MRLGGDFVHMAVPKFDLQPEATCASIIRYVSKPRNYWAYLEIRQTLTSSHAWHAKTAAPQAEVFFKAAEGTKASMERCRYPQTHCVASACGTAARSHGYKPGAWRSGASSGADCTSASGSCQSPSRCCRLRNASTPYPGMLTSCRSPPAADREGKALSARALRRTQACWVKSWCRGHPKALTAAQSRNPEARRTEHRHAGKCGSIQKGREGRRSSHHAPTPPLQGLHSGASDSRRPQVAWAACEQQQGEGRPPKYRAYRRDSGRPKPRPPMRQRPLLPEGAANCAATQVGRRERCGHAIMSCMQLEAGLCRHCMRGRCTAHSWPASKGAQLAGGRHAGACPAGRPEPGPGIRHLWPDRQRSRAGTPAPWPRQRLPHARRCPPAQRGACLGAALTACLHCWTPYTLCWHL